MTTSTTTPSQTMTGMARPEAVGAAFVQAVVTRDFDAARRLLADDARFRMLVPPGFMDEYDADSTIARIAGWFGDADPFDAETASAEEVGGRTSAGYRIRLRRDGRPYVIEQRLMLDVSDDGRITALDLLCSGFRPVVDVGQTHHFDAKDLGCADGLAAEFRRRVHQIPVGDVLVVSTSDPAAKQDLPPLARLMGHAVLSVEESDDGRLAVTVERRR